MTVIFSNKGSPHCLSRDADNCVAQEPKSLTSEKIAKVVFEVLAIIAAAGAITLGGLVVSSIAPGPFLILALAGCLLAAGCRLTASSIYDYKDPKALQKMKQAAAEEISMDKILNQHGIENLRRYNIIPKERIEEHLHLFDKGRALIKSNRESLRAGLKAVDEKYPVRYEKELERLEKKKKLIQFQKTLETDDSFGDQSAITRKVLEETDQSVWKSPPHWAIEKISLLQRDAIKKYDGEIAAVDTEIQKLKANPLAREQQKRYDLETLILHRQADNNSQFIYDHYPRIRGETHPDDMIHIGSISINPAKPVMFLGAPA